MERLTINNRYEIDDGKHWAMYLTSTKTIAGTHSRVILPPFLNNGDSKMGLLQMMASANGGPPVHREFYLPNDIVRNNVIGCLIELFEVKDDWQLLTFNRQTQTIERKDFVIRILLDDKSTYYLNLGMCYNVCSCWTDDDQAVAKIKSQITKNLRASGSIMDITDENQEWWIQDTKNNMVYKRVDFDNMTSRQITQQLWKGQKRATIRLKINNINNTT